MLTLLSKRCLHFIQAQAKDFRGIDILIVAIALYLVFRVVSSRLQITSCALPPGPKPWPLLGNLGDLPKDAEGPHFGRHKALYGPISSVRVLGTTFIILNDKKCVFDLLERRSSIYSGRPELYFGGRMVGFDRWLTTLMPYSDKLKAHRKLMYSFIGTHSALSKFQELMEIETCRFILKILNSPDQFMNHIRALPGALILKMLYGYSTDPAERDPLILLADEVVADIFSRSCTLGKWVVDILPFVRHFPEWFPGMGFKRQARLWAAKTASLCDKPYAFVQHQMMAGKAINSFILECIESGVTEDNEDGENTVKCAAASLYAGGSDTTVGALGTFYLAMVKYPSVFKRAQDEVDGVIGLERLPTFLDRSDLPYINAILKETLRWENVIDVSPHLVTEEDNYMGYRIPKGAVVVPNIWQMTHDPENYHDPFVFKPERFLGVNGLTIEQDPRSFVFGFGRRICPGKELADMSMFIAMAMSISVFNISKAKDERGCEIEPLHEYVPGTISHPKPFKCSIQPRSDKAAALIRSVTDEHAFEGGDNEVIKSL